MNLISSLMVTAAMSVAQEQWGTFETLLEGPSGGNPYLEVELKATFRQDDRQIVVSGFWDGGGTYRIRFMPPSPGEWRYETRSNRPELDGRKGAFTAAPPSAGNRGPVGVFNTFYLRYADGTPYHQFGTTCYAWIHQTRELQEQTLRTLAASPFNKIRFCVFPKDYVYNKNEPELFAFHRLPDGKFDFDRPDQAFWRHLERRVLDLQRLGIEADVILWHPYDRWGFSEMSDEQDNRYLRYCIARLGPFRNVWWSLANEYDFMTNRPKGHRGNKQWEDWDRFFSILEKEDPFGRMRGIHNGSRLYDHTKPWVTHASLQTSDMNGGLRFREKYRKPVIYDECKYEGDIPQGWGNLDARTMAQRFWLGTMNGCYVGHGETYRHPQDILWWSKGGTLRGESPRRIAWLKEFMAQAPPFHELEPMGDGRGRFVLAKPGVYYLLYALPGTPVAINLPGERPYKLDLVDPWEMKTWSAGTAAPGYFTAPAPATDLVYRFMPYATGERLRPDARASASPSEGAPPLAVRFAGSGGDRFRWDFGDGTTSAERDPSHTYAKPGLYTVTLEVSDGEGSVSQCRLTVAVDRDPSSPIVRAGFRSGETPRIRPQGRARRNPDGSIHLPDGAPWSWIEAGTGPLEDVEGLRSFTILGWLKPESLRTGSGGNRIAFCLNKDRSGIDLVALEDGRLRLSVNEWPDQVKNDSSPGRLQVGKWIFFAVTYDASAQTRNVAWYFGPPMDAPGPDEPALDRRTSYNAGPVGAGTGPLVLGNFNSTMRDHGLDRQFRGHLRGLELYGSRIGGRGALTAEAIRDRMRASAGP